MRSSLGGVDAVKKNKERERDKVVGIKEKLETHTPVHLSFRSGVCDMTLC